MPIFICICISNTDQFELQLGAWTHDNDDDKDSVRFGAVVGATEMSRPVIASAITTMLAFLPLWALGGMTGKMIFSLPAVVMTALGLSLLESLFILPGHMSMAMSVAKNPKRAFMTRLEGRYRRMLGGILEHRVAVLIVFFAALVAILVFVAPRLGIQLFPQDDSAALYIKFDENYGDSCGSVTVEKISDGTCSEIGEQIEQIAFEPWRTFEPWAASWTA